MEFTEPATMESGDVVEYIDDQQIISAVVTQSGSRQIRLLTERDRDVHVSAQRLSHHGRTRLDPSLERSRLVESLRNLSRKRSAIADALDVQTLWEVLNQEQTWIDLETMTGLCFPGSVDDDHQSGVVRALFRSRRYFKFKPDRFMPQTEAAMAAIAASEKKAARLQALIESGTAWIQAVRAGQVHASTDHHAELAGMFKSVYLFEKENPHYETVRVIMEKSGIRSPEALFKHLVAVGEWTTDENVDLLRFNTPTVFSQPVLDLARTVPEATAVALKQNGRVDLTRLSTFTIDGQSTLDFDDALSIDVRDDHLLVGIHISDVAQSIRKGDLLDGEARLRASSIYMPDHRISMAPPLLAENRLSLIKDHIRPAISTMVKLSLSGDIISYDIFPSMIRVDQQFHYFEANANAEAGSSLGTLYQIAGRFREKRLSQGAVQITLPEINVWLDEAGVPVVNRVNRDSPGRMLIAEMMILANWLSARFLAEKKIPAVFRAQPEPKERILKNGSGTLFQNWMQRKLLNRLTLRSDPDRHCGLGLDAYVTATSPIRKYVDLVTQRQLRAGLGLEKPYSQKEIDAIIEQLAQPMADVGRIQFRRTRYWLLKHLEGRIGEKEEAVVLQRRRQAYAILLTAYMIECLLPHSSGIDLKPEDLIQVTIQRVDARSNTLSVFL